MPRGPLEHARQNGFLTSQGPQAARKHLESRWRRECLQTGRPFVVLAKRFVYRPRKLEGTIWAELSGAWWLSRRLWSALQQAMPDAWVDRFGNQVRVSAIPHREAAATAHRLMSVLAACKPSQREAFDIPPALVRATARCVYNDALEGLLAVNEVYEIREIPNMMGHVVVFRPVETPLVGIHLDRFEVIQRRED